jgi:phage gpG-like protein
MPDIKINVDAKKAQDAISGIQMRLTTIAPLFPEAKKYVALANVNNFATNGLPVGGWKPLSAKYGSWKAVNFPGAPTMVRTGRLFASLSSLRGPENKTTETEMTFGLAAGEVEYAKFHQYGTTKMAKRKIVFAPPLFAKWISDKYGDYLMNGRP